MSRNEPIEPGLTVPLHRHLHTKVLPNGQEPKRRFCLDFHACVGFGELGLAAEGLAAVPREMS